MESKHIRYIDVLKGVCILMVVIFHSLDVETRKMILVPYWSLMAVPIFMIISGYVYSLSYKKKDINSMNDAYAPKNTVNKILRYTIPFFLVFVFEEAYRLMNGETESVFECIRSFFCGGFGPGSYYYPIMIQFIFLYPAIFFIVRRYGSKGVLICLIINAAYELLKTMYGMNEGLYRLLVFRYIFLIAFGCYLAEDDCILGKRTAALCLFVGLIFTTAVCYFDFVPIILNYWSSTSFVACLFIIPVIYVFFKRCSNIKFRPLEIIGKASYHIFLIQMVWFYFFSSCLNDITDNIWIKLLLNVVICTIVGVIFYRLETPLTKKIISFVYKSKFIDDKKSVNNA